MNTQGFLLLIATVVVIGGSVGGAFAGGLALGRNQGDDGTPETALLQQRFGGGQFSTGGVPGGGFPGGQLSGGAIDGQRPGPGGAAQTGQDAPSGFGGGTFGGRAGFGGILTGTVATVDGNAFTVTTESGETQVNLNDDSSIQIYEDGAVGDLSPGDQVLVILSGQPEDGEPAGAASVIVNPPEGAGVFGGGGFGGRPRSP